MMRLLVEITVAVMIVLAVSIGRTMLENLEDDAFDAELTAASNEKARYLQMGCYAMQEQH